MYGYQAARVGHNDCEMLQLAALPPSSCAAPPDPRLLPSAPGPPRRASSCSVPVEPRPPPVSLRRASPPSPPSPPCLVLPHHRAPLPPPLLPRISLAPEGLRPRGGKADGGAPGGARWRKGLGVWAPHVGRVACGSTCRRRSNTRRVRGWGDAVRRRRKQAIGTLEIFKGV